MSAIPLLITTTQPPKDESSTPGPAIEIVNTQFQAVRWPQGLRKSRWSQASDWHTIGTGGAVGLIIPDQGGLLLL